MLTELRKQTIAQAADARMRKHRQISRVIRAEDQAIEDMAREYAESALDTLVAIMNDKDALGRDRIKAATEILDRGFGRPMERSLALTLDSGSNSQDFSKLSTRDLITQALNLFRPGLDSSVASSPTTSGAGFEKGEY